MRDHIGWDLKTLGTLPFMAWVRRMEIDFIRPARGDQEITITSFVREFHGPDAIIECTMADSAGKTLSRCLMTVAHVDKETNRATDWPSDAMAPFFEPEPGVAVASPSDFAERVAATGAAFWVSAVRTPSFAGQAE